MKEQGEFGFIESIRKMFASMPSNGFEGIGDDCAVLPIGNDEALVFTSDMLNEGIHFLTDKSTAYQIGYKSLMVNISDVAAMGAKPIATLLSLALPEERFGAWSEEFMKGYHAASQKYNVKLVGGDTTRSESGVCVNVTAIGRAPLTNIKRRSAAEVGDAIMVTGKLGASGVGLRDLLEGRPLTTNAMIHLMPEARVEEGEWLGEQTEVHAMMDISDGIASDMEHIINASKKSVVLVKKSIPQAAGATINEALCCGEDYELLLTVDGRKAEELAQRFEAKFGKTLYNIGRVVEPHGDSYDIGIEREDGEVLNIVLGASGYRHF